MQGITIYQQNLELANRHIHAKRICCQKIVCIDLCPSKVSPCAMPRLLLIKSPNADETNCAMVFSFKDHILYVQMGAVPGGFQSDGMMWVAVVLQPSNKDSLQIWTFWAKYLSFSLLCAMLRPFSGTCIITGDETGCVTVIFLPWCDFPLPDGTWCEFSVSLLWHGDEWFFPPDVT